MTDHSADNPDPARDPGGPGEPPAQPGPTTGTGAKTWLIWAAVAGGLALFLIGFGAGYVTGDQVGTGGERGRYTEMHRPGSFDGDRGGDYGRPGHGRFQDNRGPFHDNRGPGPGHGGRYGGPNTQTGPSQTSPSPSEPAPEQNPQAPAN